MIKEINPLAASVELMTTAVCPFNCAYCYIPKADIMKTMHKDIKEWLSSGKFIKEVKDIWGNSLTHMGFWGAEATLTLPELTEKMPDIMSNFPNLKDFSYSTGNMTDPQIQIDFIKSLAPYKVLLKLQISLDGQKDITDTNRMLGATDMVVKNFTTLVKELQKIDMGNATVNFRFKVTHDPNNMRMFVENPETMAEYYEIFENLHAIFDRHNKQKNIGIYQRTYRPTLMVPGKYTVEDGKTFSKYLRLWHDTGMTAYSGRFMRIYDFGNELHKRHMFSCSGGDGNAGLGNGEIHMCHRTFYMNDERYINSVLKDGDMENWDVSLFNRGSIEHIKKNYIIDPNDELELLRYTYVMRGYHDFWKLQIGYVVAMVKELSAAGQADPIYTDDDVMCELLGMFLNSGLSCPMENVLNTGSVHLQVVSLIRLWSNGAFQEILRQVALDEKNNE